MLQNLRSAFFVVLTCLASGTLFSQTQTGGAKAVTASLPVLTSVAQIRALSSGVISEGQPVRLHAIVTYYQAAEGQIFVQDDTGGIYIVPPLNAPDLKAGDRVEVQGVTVPSFATNIQASAIRFESKGEFPKPVPVTWQRILDRANDCRYVKITGRVRSATLQVSNGQNALSGVRRREGLNAVADSVMPPYVLIDLQTDGGPIRVHMEDAPGLDLLGLLDSQVQFEGVAGGIFDGRFQQIGAELWVSSAAHMEVLHPAAGDPANLPLTDITQIMSGYFAPDLSRRVHVRGSVTFYQPGLELVLETPDRKAVLVNTYEQSALHIGQVVDVVGFPDPHEYSEVIRQANVLPTPAMNVIPSVPVSWNEALAGQYPFVLVSMEGKLAAEVHERHQDTLVIQAGPHVFSAMLPRTVWNQDFDQVALPEYRIGSTIRVTGVCVVHAGGPWNTERWFDLQVRSPQDVAVLTSPPWWTVKHLLYLSAALLALAIAALFWVVVLEGKVRRQNQQIRVTMEVESVRERRAGMLARERGRVLEAINSKLDLEDVLLMILRLVSTHLESQECWCELTNGTVVGNQLSENGSAPLLRRDIFSGAGERLGALVVAGVGQHWSEAAGVMEMGSSLAGLAIDNRRLYETLVHRSQYDQLTNAANRFLLESRLDEALAHASHSGTHFALIYIDLDQFKRVNDLYGHRAGDLYLQQVTQRFSEKLRTMDTLARVGGDEFIALIPVVRNRAEVDEIAQRLMRCFDEPLVIDSHPMKGSASIGIAMYPEDGETKDELKRVADTEMYSRKSSASV